MRRSILKLKEIRKHSKDPLEIDWETWHKPLRGAGIDPDALSDDLREYLTTCLFASMPNLTFTLYTKRKLLSFLKDEWAKQAAKGGWFVVADRNAEMTCVSIADGKVAIIPGYAISEQTFDVEKRYKSLKTWLAAEVRHEKACAEADAEADAADAAFEDARKADPNAVDGEGWTQLMHVVDDPEAVKRELDRGANPNHVAKETKQTPLTRAVAKRVGESVRLLMQAGANASHRTGSGHCAITQALQHNVKDLAIARILLEHGADIDAIGYHDKTALLSATAFYDLEGMAFCLEHGADPNGPEGTEPPLKSASHNMDVLRLLLESGADPNRDGVGVDVMRWCVMGKNLEGVRLLIDSGVSLKGVDTDLLHDCSDPETAKLLFAAGADPNIKLEGRASPLASNVQAHHEVADDFKRNKRAVAELLIDAGADLNVGGEGNWAKTTPLIVATRGGFLEAMQLLLERGADPTIEAGGETAMSVAAAIKPKEVAERAVALLKEHGVS